MDKSTYPQENYKERLKLFYFGIKKHFIKFYINRKMPKKNFVQIKVI